MTCAMIRLSLRAERGNLNLLMRLSRCAYNGVLPRPFKARNDIVIIYIAFILIDKK